MPAYHSAYNKAEFKSIGGFAILPIQKQKGPQAASEEGEGDDIIEEALKYFRANVFFKNFEVKGDADRTLMYITLYISQALNRVTRCNSKDSVLKEMYQLAIETFPLPGDPSFPLTSFFKTIANKSDQDALRQYLTQCRHEIGNRLAERVIDPATGKPSKWWTCFTKRKFMGKSLDPPGR
eukprot:m.221044 g.221044  ORF g.221044 m.221044 type:complete len:180 (-) comp10504_c0_seq1:53-592(-)